MAKVSFFGTEAFPSIPCSNKAFSTTVQIALLAITALGIVLAALGGAEVLAYKFVTIGSSIASVAFVALIAYKCLQKNYLESAFQKALEENNLHLIQSIWENCEVNDNFFFWGQEISSKEYVGTVEAHSFCSKIRNHIRNDITANNRATCCTAWEPILEGLEKKIGDDNLSASVPRFISYNNPIGAF